MFWEFAEYYDTGGIRNRTPKAAFNFDMTRLAGGRCNLWLTLRQQNEPGSRERLRAERVANHRVVGLIRISATPRQEALTYSFGAIVMREEDASRHERAQGSGARRSTAPQRVR